MSKFKVGDLVVDRDYNLESERQITIMLLVSFHPKKFWSIYCPCPPSELEDRWTVLIGDNFQSWTANYINEYCKRLADDTKI